MKAKFKNLVVKYWLLFFFIILFLLMATSRISFNDIWKTILSLKLWQLSALLAVYFLISFFRISSRKYLLYSLYSSCRFKNLALIHFTSMAAHYSTPAKIGFPLAVYLLNRFENIPYPYGTAAILIELTVSTGICGVIAIIGGFFYFREYSYFLFQIFLIAIVLGVITLWGLRLFFRKINNGSRLRKFISDIGDAFSHVAPGHIILYTSMMVFIQIFSSVNLVLLCYFFSAHLSIGQAVTAGSTAFFVGAVSMIPMGLGTRDASMLFYLKLFGIANSSGISIVAIQRLISTGLSYVLGTLFGAVLGLRNVIADNTNGNMKNF
jgi:uncharacterized protein (TIRG00374 family)